jgi:hypothetical protein
LPDGAVVARPGSTPAPDSQRVTIDGQQVDMPRDSLNWLNPDSAARRINTPAGQKLMVGTCASGSVQCVAHATDGSNQDIPFTRENPGKSVPDAMTKQTIEQFGHKVDPSIAATPSPADVAATRADNAARQAQATRNANKVLDGLSYVPDVGPVVRGARGIKSLSDLFRGSQGTQPKTETPAAAPGTSSGGGSDPSRPIAMPGRVIDRTGNRPTPHVGRTTPDRAGTRPPGRGDQGSASSINKDPGGRSGRKASSGTSAVNPNQDKTLVGSGAKRHPGDNAAANGGPRGPRGSTSPRGTGNSGRDIDDSGPPPNSGPPGDGRKGQLPPGQAYHQPPKLEDMQSIFGKDLRQVRGKTPVQGGGKLRPRWLDRKGQIYEFDSRHGAIEKYDRSGRKHLGEYSPSTGEQTKAPDKSRRIQK